MPQLTDEEQKDSQERQAAFIKEYEGLIEKYQHDFISYPVLLPTESGAFEVRVQTQAVDKKYRPVPSNII